MRLIILGSSASYALPGEATSGYLIQSKGQSLCLDLGTGSLSNLFRWQDPADIEALILSHLHADHFIDIYPFRLYLNFEKPNEKMTVYAPENAAKQLASMLSSRGREIFERTLVFKPISENKTIKINDFKVSFANMVHDIDSYAIRVESNGKSLVYSSDTAYNNKLIKFAKDADLLLAESTLSVKVPDVRHMTAADAGTLASQANVKKLILTHVWPTFKDTKTIAETAKFYSGPVEIAAANKVFDV